MSFPVPDNEIQRIEALLKLRILDTDNDQVYDTIAKLAASILEVPTAMITFVDSDRAFVKAIVGNDAREGSREHSFCTHTILSVDSSLLVTDVFADERFATNPYVVGDPKIRFYYGVPLVTSDKCAVGTICAIDSTPRLAPTKKQVEAIGYLSKLVMTHLEFREHVFNIYDEFQKLKSLPLPETNRQEISEIYGKLSKDCDLILEKIKARKTKR